LVANDGVTVAPAPLEDPVLDTILPFCATKSFIATHELLDIKIGSEIELLETTVGPLGKSPVSQLA
jgi:hypothetical protein